MKKFIFVFLILVFMFSACTSNETQVEITPTATISPTITYTSTPNITPLPTIPTFTPTFDVSTIVTVTPAEKAACPKIKEDVKIKLSTFYDTFDYQPDLIQALNEGGSIRNIVGALEKELTEYYSYSFNITIKYQTIDVTNDGVHEIILYGNRNKALILGCDSGVYKELYSIKYIEYLEINIIDANHNGIPEIFIGDEICNAQCGFRLSIIEWQINSFKQLLVDIDAYPSTWSSLSIENIDNDIPMEIYWQNGIRFDALVDSIFRKETVIYKWSGNFYVPLTSFYSAPTFRFQAIQDADQATINKEYDKALTHYQNVVNKKNLDWWSTEREEYERLTNPFTFDDINNPPTFQPEPIEDESEYPSLAAYAYYRIMLIQLAQGQTEEANKTYQTLLDTFGNDIYAIPYIEMTNAFLQAYQINQKMYDGCAAAIQYAVENSEMLSALGDSHHWEQAKKYKPEDVCPFR